VNKAFFDHAMKTINEMTVDELEAGLKEAGFEFVRRHRATDFPLPEGDIQAPPVDHPHRRAGDNNG
jgi:hypothetical protein